MRAPRVRFDSHRNLASNGLTEAGAGMGFARGTATEAEGIDDEETAELPLVDPLMPADIFATDVDVEVLGGIVRITTSARRRNVFGDIERQVVARHVFTEADLWRCLTKVMAAMAPKGPCS